MLYHDDAVMAFAAGVLIVLAGLAGFLAYAVYSIPVTP